MNEFKLIDALIKKIPRPMQGVIPIGDDTGAQFIRRRINLLMTADAVVDGVDFHAAKIRPELAGRKALAINLSDIAAMGGTPASCVITLGIPQGFSAKWLTRFYAGLAGLAKRHKVLIVGGDISKAKQFFASIALTGSAQTGRIIQRSGAKAGDLLYVTGKLGGSILRHHFSFEPRVEEGKFLASKKYATSMIDVSDGLWQDLEHILKASKAGARVNLDQIPVSGDALRLAKRNPCKALERALTDGEDFELLFTVPKAKAVRFEKEWRKKFPKTGLSPIGQIHKGRGIEWFYEGQKTVMKMNSKKGYQHFS